MLCFIELDDIPGVAELADAADSKSAGDHSPCGFDSLLRDHDFTHIQKGADFCKGNV